MFRTAFSIVAVASLLAALPSAAAAAQAKAGAAVAAKPSTNATVNLNTASAVDLEALPGIGAKTAARIVEYRQKNGPFKKIEELMNVRGVGEKNFLKLKPQITVGTAKADHDDRQQP
jgi:competence protein ComEA